MKVSEGKLIYILENTHFKIINEALKRSYTNQRVGGSNPSGHTTAIFSEAIYRKKYKFNKFLTHIKNI